MRSPGDDAPRDGAVPWLERGARAGAVAALLLAWWGQGAPADVAGRAAAPVAVADTALAPLADSARRWLLVRGRASVDADRVPDAPPLTIIARVIPGAPARGVLGTLPSAGVSLRWRDASGAAATAVQALRQPGADGPLDVRAVAGASGVVTLHDQGGLLDSVSAAPGRVHAWRLSSPQGAVTVRWPAPASAAGAPAVPTMGQAIGGGWARARTSPSVVRILALPGWEAKFVAAALEEAGWRVEGRWPVAPTADVTLGARLPLDTATHAAVVVMDSAVGVAEGAAVRRFVEAGGGLVLAGDGLRWPGAAVGRAADLRPAEAAGWRRGVEGGVRSATPRAGLEVWRLAPARGAHVLARGGDGAPVLVVRAHGNGRVAAVAYRDSWRWRMAGNDDGVAGHRGWWDGVVRLVATAGADAEVPVSPWPGDGAPWLDLVARLGVPAAEALPLAQSPGPSQRSGVPRIRAVARRLGGALYLAAAVLLLMEWGARRRRGVP
ncbi:MAG: hypothetical protein KJT01_09575 [Gemmatimonadetes bacterium]|nr:hypothetical protein [Gemmatimonadota bacterium]